MRNIGRRIRSSFGMGSSRVAIRSQMAWYWRWTVNVLMMAAVAAVVWWLVENSYRITGFNIDEVRQQMASLTEENRGLKRDLDTAKGSLTERDRQLQIEKAAQTELARTVVQLQEENAGMKHDLVQLRTQVIERDRQLQVERAAQGELARSVAGLQEENASLKEDLGFLRKLMSSGATVEGLVVSDLKVERDGGPNQYRYRFLLTQGGQRKQDFRGKVQVLARVAQGPNVNTYTFPEPSAGDAAGAVDFRFYQKIEGRFTVPEGGQLRSAEIRILAVPGGQVKLSRTVNVQ